MNREELYKFVKNARRRSVETILEGMGSSEKTVDPEFDTYTKSYGELMHDMNECSDCITSTLSKQKKFFDEAVKLSESLVRIYEKSKTPECWPASVPQKLTLGESAVRYRNSLKNIHWMHRRCVAKCCTEVILQPFRSAIGSIGPDIDRDTAECATICKDLDSYQRRLKVFQSKLDSAVGKSSEPVARADVDKFERKAATARKAYENLKSKSKTKICSAKGTFDVMVDMELVTMLVTQQDLFETSSKQLSEIIDELPQDKVSQVRSKLDEHKKLEIQSQEKIRLEHGRRASFIIRRQSSRMSTESESSDPPSPSTGPPPPFPTSSETSGPIPSPYSSTTLETNDNPPPPFSNSSVESAPPPPDTTTTTKTDDDAPPPFSKASVKSAPPPQVNTTTVTSDDPPPPFPKSSVTSSPLPPTTTTDPPPPFPSATVSSTPPPPTTTTDPPPPLPSATVSSAPPPPTTTTDPPPPFPSATVSSAPPPPTTTTSTSAVFAIALYDCDAERDDELTLSVGDKIEILDNSDAAWWKGKSLSTDMTGVFPSNYVQKC